MKRSKLILFRAIGELKDAVAKHIENGSLWKVYGEPSLPCGYWVIDYHAYPKEQRIRLLETARQKRPESRYAIVHMEKNDSGKVAYEVVEL